MTDKAYILWQIKQEYNLWLDYVKDKRQQYRDRIAKFWNQWTKKKDKINVNMIANYIDTMIASSRSEGTKTKFVSKDWWIWQEEAENLTSVFEFDTKEQEYQQLMYQIEQDKYFFGVWVLAYLWFNTSKKVPNFRTINPLSWIPDPLPSQTGLFNWQNYRFHGFVMSTNTYDLKQKSWLDVVEVNKWIEYQFNDEKNKDRHAYEDKNNLWRAAKLANLQYNLSIDIYYHYTTIEGKKYLFITDSAITHIFSQQELKATLKEELIDSSLIPRPIALNYYDPERDNPFGRSVCDKIEDKQNAKSILLNLAVIKAKKETLWGTMIVNSRLIKNKEELSKPSTDVKFLYTDENIQEETPISNALYEVPQSQVKQDTFSMIQMLEREAMEDTSIDSIQSGVMPDKTMTKAEAQQLQANANMKMSAKQAISNWFYKDFAFLRWRSYQTNFKDAMKKFITINDNFEWKTISITKDNLYTKNTPSIIVGTKADIEAINEKHKSFMNLQLPQILQDQWIPEISKMFARRLTYRLNWLATNEVNILCPMSPDERLAQEYLFMVNNNITPKSLLSNPWIDLFTVYLYIQKAQDNETKDKILSVLEKMIIEQGKQKLEAQQQNGSMSNTASNIQMSQATQSQWQDIKSRQDLQPN